MYVEKSIVLSFRTFLQASRYDSCAGKEQHFRFERCGGKPMILISQITAAIAQFTDPYEFPPVSLPAFITLDTTVNGIESEVTIRTQHCIVECAIGRAVLNVSGNETAVDWFIELLRAVGQVGIGRGRRYGWGRFDVEILPASTEAQCSADTEATGGTDAETKG